MELRKYFFDTYAMLGIVYGEPGYSSYEKDVSAITTQLNLMEMYFILLRDNGEDVAEKAYSRFLNYSIEIDDETIKEAMKFRLANKAKRLSYVDCISYLSSIKNNSLFLTGDKEFKDFPNVEFVK